MNPQHLLLQPPDQRLIQRYESLRQRPNAPPNGGLGRALLMHHGMAAWMHAWASTAPGLAPLPRAAPTPEPRPLAPSLPTDLERPLVQLLAQMACNVYRRATP